MLPHASPCALVLPLIEVGDEKHRLPCLLHVLLLALNHNTTMGPTGNEGTL